MVSAHRIETRRDFVKPLQYVTEGDSGATPALFGVPVDSSTFVALGHVRDLNLQPDIQRIDTEVLGSEDVVNAILTSKLYAFQVTFEPTDEVFLKIATIPVAGVGTVSESYTFTFSELLNGIENFTQMNGCRPTNTQLRLNQGVWECTMTFVCREITLPNTTDPNGGVPVYVTEPTASSISHSAVADHFIWNAVITADSSFSLNVTRNYAVMTVNGETLIVYTFPVSRTVEFTVETYVKDVLIETDWEAVTERAASYEFDATNTVDFINCVVSGYSKAKSSSGTDAFKESVTVRAEGLNWT